MLPVETKAGVLRLEIFEDGVPPRFRLYADTAPLPEPGATIETIRPDGARQVFELARRGAYLESVDEVPEPHGFAVHVQIGAERPRIIFEEHEHAAGAADRDNNMRAALVHVVADAAVSVLVIVGLILAKVFGWLWMDPLAGMIGAAVIASWAWGLIRVTGGILLDMNPDEQMAEKLRAAVEADGDRLADLHLWRLGPGHLGAIVAVATALERGPAYYKAKLARFRSVSHLTVEVQRI
jgi:cation diffusion facilitator family transporter